jgi:hypothetical protein
MCLELSTPVAAAVPETIRRVRGLAVQLVAETSA